MTVNRITNIVILTSCILLSGCDLVSPSENDTLNLVAELAPVTIAGSSSTIVTDSKGNLFYPDCNRGVIIKVSSTGSQNEFASYGYSGGFATIAIDAHDNLYVAHPSGVITKISSDGVVSDFAILPNLTDVRLMKVDGNGNVFYTEMTYDYFSTNRIMKVTPAGVVSLFAGTGSIGAQNGYGASASFNNPQDLAIDPSGNVYVSDAKNYLIRKISPSGLVTTFAGSGAQGVIDGTGTSASFYFYDGGAEHGEAISAYLAMDPSGNLFVGDNAGETGYIRKITPSGVVSIYCGNGSGTETDVTGLCTNTGLWVNGGLTVGQGGLIFFVSGDLLYGVSNLLTFIAPGNEN